jgi:glycosyltransferase involved in cell wall biosynthesis
MERLTAALATKVAVNSPSLRARVEALRLVPVAKLHQTTPASSHGVDTRHYAPTRPDGAFAAQCGIRHGRPVVGFVGRLTHDKGIDTLLAAWDRLAAAGVAAQLLVVGPQDEPDSQVYLERLRAVGDVVVVGAVDDVRPYFALMDVHVLPSLREGFPNVVLEASAMAIPTVTTDATGCIDSVRDGETGHLVAAGDASALAAVLAELLREPGRARELGAAARTWVEREFVPERVVRSLWSPVRPATAPVVLHVVNNLGTGGAERLVVELADLATKRGLEARIAVLGPTPAASPVLADALSRGIEVVQLGAHRFDPRVIHRLRREARRADVVHAHLFPAFYVASLVRGPRLVVTEHSPTNSRRARRALRPIERWVYRRYDARAAISASVAESLEQHLDLIGLPRQVTVVANGIRLDRYRPAAADEPSGQLRLVAVGTLDDRKNLGAAIRAVAEVPGVALTVVGDGPQRRRLETLAAATGAPVSFLGMRDDVPRILRQHDALVMTSTYEGFGLVAVEAMATGLPVLAPALPGLGDVVGEAGLLHRPGDHDALVRHIRLLDDDPALRGRLGSVGLERAASFGIERTFDSYLTTYAIAEQD